MGSHTLRRLLALGLMLALTAPAAAHAAPAQPSFSDLRIDAGQLDFLQQTVSIQIYRPDESGRLTVDDTLLHLCTLNRVTHDASFYIQPKVDGVWATVDYLTDLNGDGVYEMIDTGDAAAQWPLVPQPDGTLKLGSQPAAQQRGQTYVLAASTLVEGGEMAALTRYADGAAPLDVGGDPAKAGRPLYLVNLHYAPDGQQEQIQSYYLKIYGQVLIPDDVSPSDSCYDAVEHCLLKGYLSSTGQGKFSPGQQVDRAQLAQILWRMGGSLSAKDHPAFRDLGKDHWAYQAAAWCCQEGLMSGTGQGTFSPGTPLTREQLALVLFQFSSRTASEMESASHSLDKFSDRGNVSSWAQTGLEWAVVNGLLTGYDDGTIRPQGPVTRADIACALYALDTRLGAR